MTRAGNGFHFYRRFIFSFVTVCFALLVTSAGYTQETTPDRKGTILLTIFLKHDQSKSLDEIQARMKKSGFYTSFPPAGVEIVTWYVVMGIGQVVTLRVPAEKLREVNLAIEYGAWGSYHTEIYATYDYRPIWETEQKERR